MNIYYIILYIEATALFGCFKNTVINSVTNSEQSMISLIDGTR